MNTSHVMEGRVSVWVDDRCLYPLYVQCVAVGCWRLTDCATLVTQSAVSTWPAVSCLTKMEGGREAMPSQSAHTDGTVPCHGWGGWMGGCTYTRKCPSRHAQCCKTIVSQTTRQADRQAQEGGREDVQMARAFADLLLGRFIDALQTGGSHVAAHPHAWQHWAPTHPHAIHRQTGRQTDRWTGVEGDVHASVFRCLVGYFVCVVAPRRFSIRLSCTGWHVRLGKRGR
mmetsp:Transcript_23296/g.66771  ORF Transcript_23296/g.66771 Transcript_23296/m.66771 type:complete len:227 (+) Transcript_23296:487-1167(+)